MRTRSALQKLVPCLALCLQVWAPAASAQGSNPTPAGEILFTSNRDGGIFQLYRMADDGSGVRRVTREPMEATQVDVSADRTKAVFVSVKQGRPDLYVADLASGQVQQLTDDAAMEATPVWSPDGKSVVYQSYRSSRPQLYLINADGTGQRKLTDGDGEESAPAFSPDGSKVAYVVIVSQRKAQIRAADVATGKSTVLGAEPMVGGEGGPRWSPDGTRLAYFMLASEATNIFTVRADGTGRTALTTGTDKNNEPQWSPDGKRLVFLSIRKPSARQAIYAMDADGGQQRELIGGLEEHFVVRWTPDNKGLLFVRFHNGAGQIYAASADGANLRKISNGVGYDADFSFGRTGIGPQAMAAR